MGELIKFFKCGSRACGHYSPFNVAEVRAAVGGLVVECESCKSKWAVSFLKQNCCKIKLHFTSVERGNNKPITMMQSFNKR